MNARGILSCAQAERSRKNLAAELERVTAALREIMAVRLDESIESVDVAAGIARLQMRSIAADALAGAARAAQEPPYPVAKPTERDRDEGRAVAERLGLLDDARAAQEDAHGD
jgi:anthranilate phosphoribosyltransferase